MVNLCVSANGKQVVYDPVNSHTATHFHDSSHLKEVAAAVLSTHELIGPLVAQEIEVGRVIGASNVVEVDESDDIVYAMRKNREDQGHVPFTKSRVSVPSSLLSVYLVEQDDGIYELASAWIGSYESPMFPQMKNATIDSIPYWRAHAFVWGSQEIIPGTERSDCPW